MQQKLLEHVFIELKSFIINLKGSYFMTQFIILLLTTSSLILMFKNYLAIISVINSNVFGIVFFVIFLVWLNSIAFTSDNIIRTIKDKQHKKELKNKFIFLYNNSNPRTKDLILNILENNKPFYPLMNLDYFVKNELECICEECKLSITISNEQIKMNLNTLNTLKNYFN